MRHTESLTRRRFLRHSAAVLAAPLVFQRSILGANEKLNVAGIGVGGKGFSDIALCDSESIVALCDVDLENAKGAYKRFPDAKRYTDYRVMFEKEKIDAVTISTPDHVHAPAALLAMRLGKHVHCQKPLCHRVEEARLMARVAREKRVATQMGNQGHASPHLRRMVEILRGGALGKVSEVHVWTDRPIWPQGIERPKDTPPIPAHVSWDLWLGPAPERPYHPAYLPFKWRGWWDFGTGAVGDIACHSIDLPFWALDLGAPKSVEATSSGLFAETAPLWSVITYEFPARGENPPVRLVWYDGGKRPPQEKFPGVTFDKNGIVFVGERDAAYVFYQPGKGRTTLFRSGAKLEDFRSIAETLPRRPGVDGDEAGDRQHRLEWIEAAKGGPAALSNFEYAGPLAEVALLGNVALRAGKRIEWDSLAMRVPNAPEAEDLLRKSYRKGWEIA